MELYFQILLDKIILSILIFGGLNWGFIGLFRKNLLNYMLSYSKYTFHANRIIYVIIGLCALFKMFKRDFYLPFLGKSVFPCDSLKLKTPKESTIKTSIRTKPNSNVIYWASEGTNDIIMKHPIQAYNKYSNSGVVLSNNEGIANLYVRKPIPYKVPFGYNLKPHIHYRTCLGNGMLSEIKTIFLK